MSRRAVLVLAALALLAAVMIGVARVTGGGDATHPLGTEVVVGHHEPRDDGSEGARATLGLTVLAVRRGTQDDLQANGIELEPEDRTATPYYVDARYENRGPDTIERPPSLGLDDGDGNTFGRLLVFGIGERPFAPCREAARPLEPGESYESCTLVLVPEGIDVVRVSFLSDRGPGEEPEWVYWAPE